MRLTQLCGIVYKERRKDFSFPVVRKKENVTLIGENKKKETLHKEV